MKKNILATMLVVGIAIMMSSCYTFTHNVGMGSQTGEKVKQKNSYLFYGLINISSTNPKEMAGGAENYEVTIKHSFLDGFLSAITCGIYTPTTVIVKK